MNTRAPDMHKSSLPEDRGLWSTAEGEREDSAILPSSLKRLTVGP